MWLWRWIACGWVFSALDFVLVSALAFVSVSASALASVPFNKIKTHIKWKATPGAKIRTKKENIHAYQTADMRKNAPT